MNCRSTLLPSSSSSPGVVSLCSSSESDESGSGSAGVPGAAARFGGAATIGAGGSGQCPVQNELLEPSRGLLKINLGNRKAGLIWSGPSVVPKKITNLVPTLVIDTPKVLELAIFTSSRSPCSLFSCWSGGTRADLDACRKLSGFSWCD